MRILISATVTTAGLCFYGLALAAGNSIPNAPSATQAQSPSDASATPTAASNEDMTEVQSKLASAGLYHGKVDGVNGAETKQALLQFQKKNGLEPTGQLDQQTQEKLGMSGSSSSSGSSSPSSSGSAGNSSAGSASSAGAATAGSPDASPSTSTKPQP
jgi:peptidoglycan hydrolase-like protein with peptidoglycan-binding domain